MTTNLSYTYIKNEKKEEFNKQSAPLKHESFLIVKITIRQ